VRASSQASEAKRGQAHTVAGALRFQRADPRRSVGSMDIDLSQIASIPAAREAVEKAINRRDCPFCGSAHWMPLAEDRVLVLQEASSTAWGNPSGDSDDWIASGAVSFVCEGCGFLRIHAPTGP